MKEDKIKKKSVLQRNRVRVFILILLLVSLLGTLVWFTDLRYFVSTNDSRIATDIIRVSPSGVGGRVERIYIEEGMRVSKNQVLLEIDHELPLVAYDKAKAKYSLAKIDFDRVRQLYFKDTAPKKDLDVAQTNLIVTEAELRNAKIVLDNTYVKSPIDGIVVQKPAIVGNSLEQGQVGVIISDVDNAWVQANIEETKIGRIKVGQRVTVKVDEGGILFGRVKEITSATASQFSLMPAENAAGNFTKQVQRIPVKIALDSHPGRILRAGQSVIIRIQVGK